MNPDFQEIRKLIERRFRRRIRFAVHLTLFVLAGMVTTWYMMTEYYYTQNQFFVILMMGWTVLLVAHWGYLRMANARDMEIESAWGRVYGNPAESDPATYAASNRLQVPETDPVEDEWIDEKPKRRLRED